MVGGAEHGSRVARLARVVAHLTAAETGSPTTPDQDHALPTDVATVVVVTGASGYVGSWLCRLLLDRGHMVRACVRDAQNDRKAGFLKAWPEYGTRQLTVFSADMTQPHTYDSIFEGAHVVFHPAEVFMSFSHGRDFQTAKKEFGAKPSLANLNAKAMQSSQYIVDSINKSTTVRRLVYTSSVAAMSPGTWENQFNMDETREPNAKVFGGESYAVTKRATEHFFSYQATLSGGRWSALIGNPGDIIGPILSPHQAADTWQGQIAGVLRGGPIPQEPDGRPWYAVDVRDVAEGEIRLAESNTIPSGTRVMLASGDMVPQDAISGRIVEIFPEYAGRIGTEVCPNKNAKGKIVRNKPFWMRVFINNTRARLLLGMDFKEWDDTLSATVNSLVNVGEVIVPQ